MTICTVSPPLSISLLAVSSVASITVTPLMATMRSPVRTHPNLYSKELEMLEEMLEVDMDNRVIQLDLKLCKNET